MQIFDKLPSNQAVGVEPPSAPIVSVSMPVGVRVLVCVTLFWPSVKIERLLVANHTPTANVQRLVEMMVVPAALLVVPSPD